MSSENKFLSILNRLEEADTGITEKTAAAAPAAVSSEAAMLQQVRTVSDAMSKTAAVVETGPVPELQEMVKSAQAAEEQQILKQAQFMGAAVADGFMQRFAQYDASLAQQGVKTGSVADTADLEKVAQAAYASAVQDMEKTAAEQYNQGFKDQLAQVQKTAAEIHYAGQSSARNVINALRSA